MRGHGSVLVRYERNWSLWQFVRALRGSARGLSRVCPVHIREVAGAGGSPEALLDDGGVEGGLLPIVAGKLLLEQAAAGDELIEGRERGGNLAGGVGEAGGEVGGGANQRGSARGGALGGAFLAHCGGDGGAGSEGGARFPLAVVLSPGCNSWVPLGKCFLDVRSVAASLLGAAVVVRCGRIRVPLGKCRKTAQSACGALVVPRFGSAVSKRRFSSINDDLNVPLLPNKLLYRCVL